MQATLHRKPPSTTWLGALGGLLITAVIGAVLAVASPGQAQTNLPPCGGPARPFICDDSHVANEDVYVLRDRRPSPDIVVEEGTTGEIGDLSRNTRQQVVYWLSGDDADDFSIDADGVVSNVRAFDYSVDREFNFNVNVRFVFDRYEDFGISRAYTVTVAGEGTVPPPLPEAPTNLRSTDWQRNSVTLSWDDPDDDSITGYQILRRLRGCRGCKLQVYVADTGSADTTYTDTGGVTDKWYVYRVKAINETGVSSWSNYVWGVAR